MKLFAQLLVLGLAADLTVASTWFSKAVYNKWHQTELERWLSDNNIPYPSPADRKDLESLVKENWQTKVASPYSDWNADQLAAYLKEKGAETKDAAAENKDSLIASVKKYWYEAEDKAEDAWASVKDWVFDSWNESQLKAFLKKHNIPVPEPAHKQALVDAARNNYDAIAKKTGETAAYPGNWLYESWSESDLKEWLDYHGIPAPQPTSRDKLIATVRRNSRLASLKASELTASASASAQAAQETLTEKLLESWSDSDIKAWADKNGIRVPQGSKRNELIAIARKHRAQLTGDTAYSSLSSAAAKASASGASAASKASASGVSAASKASASGASAYGAATSSAGNAFAKATDEASLKIQEAFDAAISTWSDSRLKAYLDSRGVPVPQNGKRDELLAAVRLHGHKAATGYSAWTFDTWTYDNLKQWLSSSGNKAAEKAANKAGATRDELASAAQSYYAEASKTGGTAYASVTSYLSKHTDAAKDTMFDTWSDSELKSYLDSYGVPVPQGTKGNELKAFARRQATYFRYGTSTPQGTLWAKLQESAQWVMDQLRIGAAKGSKEASYQAQKATDYAKEAGQTAVHAAQEKATAAKHRVQEEL